MAEIRALIDRLERDRTLHKEEFIELLTRYTAEDFAYIREKARKTAQSIFGDKIYTRGLIEFSNYCRNDCYYCGIRRSNGEVDRYRLSKEDILKCCDIGYELGFRTYVLQGGEDGAFNDDIMTDLIVSIKEKHPDCAITLSAGELSYESYKRYFEAGADRYLLRHETANADHYAKLHPERLTLEARKKCLYDLKDIGYQVGTGFMVGSPYQTPENLAEDLFFIKEFQPEMIGIGPFLPHHQTPFADQEKGSYELTLLLIAILRLLIPNANIPSTTALGTINPRGREEGILSGANVVMPNLSPVDVRKNYELYDNKICTGDEAAECRMCLQGRMESIGYRLVNERGDFQPLI